MAQYAVSIGNLADTQLLTVVSNPLFGYVDCFQSIEGWRVEHYRFSVRPNGAGFDVHEIWYGKPRRVQGGLLPFTRKQLLRMLQENRNAGVWDCLQQQLILLFEHHHYVFLETHGYSVFHMTLMSRYINQDYPYIYWLVLLRDCRWSNETNHDAITREILAQALGIASLSNGQMKALRKLEINSYVSVEHITTALHFIAHQWPECKKFTAHVASLKPELLQMAVWLLKLQPALIAARWLTMNELQQWIEKDNQ